MRPQRVDAQRVADAVVHAEIRIARRDAVELIAIVDARGRASLHLMGERGLSAIAVIDIHARVDRAVRERAEPGGIRRAPEKRRLLEVDARVVGGLKERRNALVGRNVRAYIAEEAASLQ